MTTILLIILGGIALVALLMMLISLFKVKAWVYAHSRRDHRIVPIGFLAEGDNGEVPKVHLTGAAAGRAIGRVKMDGNEPNAYVELLTSDFSDDAEKPQYRTYGYITEEGYIYKRPAENKKPELIGYTARPSAPEQPTIFGERSWRDLWLKCRLNVYAGKPAAAPPGEAATPGKEKQVRRVSKRPVAYSIHTSIHSSRRDPMPYEARACAFGMLFGLYNRQNYREYYRSPGFGWKDTALPAAFIYALLYAAWYIVSVKVLGVRFIGFKLWLAAPIFATYFAVWAIVRAIKIECIERSDTVQPKIDLFNKILGQKNFDIAIMVCCVITLAFSGTYYRFNFLPLALVLIIAITVNMGLRSSKRRWEVANPLAPEDEEESGEEAEGRNPAGDIERTYEWELDSRNAKDVTGKLALYFYGQYIADLRYMNPFYNQRNDKPVKVMIEDMFNYLREHKSLTARTRHIASYIKRTAALRQLGEEDTMQFALDFVQEPNIRFMMNRDSSSINRFELYVRYPDETLYDKEADSNSKAMLAAVLFHFLGHDVLFLLSRVQHFGAIGVRVRSEWVEGDRIFGMEMERATFEHNGKRYLFCETTSDGFRIGGTIYGMRFEDFDERVELPLIASGADDNNADTRTCLYNWDLDSVAGNKLHGKLTLEFDNGEMAALRSRNPFLTYGADADTYEDKIKKMLADLRQTPGSMDNVEKVAAYIRKTVEEAGLPEIEMVQFALDFCQEPNIHYCVDEDSAGIRFAREYMRFPDEVLYDKEGDCDCKSSLTAALLKQLGYPTIIMLSQKLQHAGIGVEYNPAWADAIKAEDKTTVLREHNGKTYLYCETTGDNFKVGQIDKGQSIQDFETIVEV